jgi:hypothetical protein
VGEVTGGGDLAARGALAAKAVRLVEQRRVLLLEPGLAAVLGDSHDYHVTAGAWGVACTCQVRGLCSHVVAAMIVWQEGRPL